jgi:hypothetical protein
VRLIPQKVTIMTRVPAKVLTVEKLYNEYLVTVQVGRDNFAGKYDRLHFGENMPRFGWYRHGRLDLIFFHDPYLYAGQEFPLWSND